MEHSETGLVDSTLQDAPVIKVSEPDTCIAALEKALPPVFTRQELYKQTGGLISPKTMANIDWAGNGPPSQKYGRRRVYERKSFLKWFQQRLTNNKN